MLRSLPNKALELPGLRPFKRDSILAARVGSRRDSVSGRQLNADPLDGGTPSCNDVGSR